MKASNVRAQIEIDLTWSLLCCLHTFTLSSIRSLAVKYRERVTECVS